MTTQLVQLPKPRQAKVVHNLTWEQLEESDRFLKDFPGTSLEEAGIRYYRRGGLSYRSGLLPGLPLDLFCHGITDRDKYDAVRRFQQVLVRALGEVTMVSFMPCRPVLQKLLHFPGSAVRSIHSHPGLESHKFPRLTVQEVTG